MTCSLDGKTLVVTSMSESDEAIGAESVVWDTTKNKAMKKFTVKGMSRSWTVAFTENNVNWTSGSAVSFQSTASAGTAVTFTVTDEVDVISATVKIKAIQIGPIQDLAGKNIRRCTVNLLEVSS